MVNKTIQLLFFLLFITMLAGYGVLTFHQPETHSSEKRQLAKMPSQPSNSDELRNWPKHFESWLNDHLHQRMKIIREFNLARYQLDISPQTGVVIGKNKWTYGNTDGIIEDFRNVRLFSHQELKNWVSYLKYRQHIAEQNGYRYLFIVTPNKATIHDEHMPDYITRVNPNSRLDQLITAAKGNGIELINLRPALKKGKKEGDVYISRDSHWNYRGAEIAHTEIVNFLAGDFPELYWQPLPAEEYVYLDAGQLFHKEIIFYAGQMFMLGFKHHPDFQDVQPVHPRIFPDNLCHKRSLIESEYYKKHAKQKREKFFFQTTCADKPYRLLVFRDSFTTAMQKYVSETFGYAAFIWAYPDMIEFEQAVKATRPEIVIEQRVERFLTKIPKPGIHYPKALQQ